MASRSLLVITAGFYGPATRAATGNRMVRAAPGPAGDATAEPMS